MNGTDRDFQPPRILVVDDSRMIRSVLLRVLQPLNALVSTAENGAQGLELANAETFDLIITDTEMPKLDGFKLCQRLRENPATRAIPVIILPSSESDEDLETGFAIGATAYILKQRVTTDLIPRIRGILRGTLALKGHTILLVDDSPPLLQAFGEMLAQAGASTFLAANGAKALETLDRIRPDLIVSDMRMPYLDGPALYDEIRQREHLAHIPFLAMGGSADRRAMRELTRRGAAASLVKPFQAEELIDLAERLLSEHFHAIFKKTTCFNDERSGLLRSLFDMVQRWESRDKSFANHSTAVTRLTRGMGKKLRLCPSDMEQLAIASQLHDIGKIPLRDSVLFKPGSLTDEETEIVKTHPAIGAEVLAQAKGLSENIRQGILHHHERMDGSGYPEGLVGETIPLLARIIAVADMYTALVSERPQRAAYSRDKACQIIEDAKGKTLCPVCVDAFLGYMAQALKRPLAQAGTKLQALPDPGKPLAEAALLLVDHNLTFLGFLRRSLHEMGARNIITANDGKAAWRLINDMSIDVVVCDSDVPSINGEELLRRIRKSEAYQNLPFIMISAHHDKAHSARAAKLLVTDYLLKPLTARDLIEKVKAILAQSTYQQADGAGTERSKIPVETFLNTAAAGVAEAHEAMCSTLTKRFRFHVRRLLGNDLHPEYEPYIDEAGQRYASEIKELHLQHYVCKVNELVCSAIRQQFEPGAKRIVSGKRIFEISREFAGHTHGLFKKNVDLCLQQTSEAACTEEQKREALNDFNIAYRNIITRTDLSNIDILSTCNRFNTGKEMSPADHARFLEKVRPQKTHEIDMVDHFGRGLLEPVALLYTIADHDAAETQFAEFFPRFLCAPVLKALKFFILGLEKYNTINSLFAKEITQYCESMSRFDLEDLRDFFTREKIQIFLASYQLFILKVLMDPKKLEAFVFNVNSNLKNTGELDTYAFSDGHLSMLTTAWAQYVAEHKSKLKSRKAASPILLHYLPGMFDSGAPLTAAPSSQTSPGV